MSFIPPTGVLGDLCTLARERVAESRRLPLPMPVRPLEPFAFHDALSQKAREGRFPLICEVKRASPSAGTLRAKLEVGQQARVYEAGGAAAVSVLTEPTRFLGNLGDLLKVREAVKVPLLRKDFVVDTHMVEEAYAYGADAVLLIAAAIPPEMLLACATRADDLGLDVLLELIYPRDLDVLSLRPWPIVGINARDLETLEIDMGRFRELATAARAGEPAGAPRLLVAESGLSSRTAVESVRKDGADAALIGEALMRAEHPARLIEAWSGR